MQHISELTFSGYACFREKQSLEDLKDINFLIGANNSGKTRVLYFVSNVLRAYMGSNDTSIGQRNMEWSFRIDSQKPVKSYYKGKNNFDVKAYSQSASWFIQNIGNASHGQNTFLPRICRESAIRQVFQKRHIEDGFFDEANLDGKGLIALLGAWQQDVPRYKDTLKRIVSYMRQYSKECAQLGDFIELMEELKTKDKLKNGLVSDVISEWKKKFNKKFSPDKYETFKGYDDGKFLPNDLIILMDFLRVVEPSLDDDSRNELKSLDTTWDKDLVAALSQNILFYLSNDNKKENLLNNISTLRLCNNWQNLSDDIEKILLNDDVMKIWEAKRVERLFLLNDFLQGVSGYTDYRIHVRHAGDNPTPTLEISKTIDGKPEPQWFDLSQIGAGVQEAIMLATYALMYENTIVCVEEPELHMHPKMQRNFVEFLATKTPSNQYFIATHSAHLINTVHNPTCAEKIKIFRIKSENGWSQIESSVSGDNYSLFRTLESMGYRASDILQVPFIIFVEGQSDAVYIREWIKLADSRLKVGVHYEFMSYGGRSFYYLSGEEIDTKQADALYNKLTELPKIVRNLAIVFDSDLGTEEIPQPGTNTTYDKKVEIKEAVENNNQNRNSGIGWITEGREIENFVPPEYICEFQKIRTTYQNLEDENWATPLTMQLDRTTARFVDYFKINHREDKIEKKVEKDSKKTKLPGDVQVQAVPELEPKQKKISVSKTEMAEWIVKNKKLDLDMPYLRENIEAIVKLIQNANGMS